MMFSGARTTAPKFSIGGWAMQTTAQRLVKPFASHTLGFVFRLRLGFGCCGTLQLCWCTDAPNQATNVLLYS